MHPLIQYLETRLKEPLPSRQALEMMFPNIRPMPDAVPDNAHLSAVMIGLFQKEQYWHFLAIRRTEDGRAHSGQIAFPGGRLEPTDQDLWDTALRETEEEIGLGQEFVRPIGNLSPIYIPVSNFRVFPFVTHIHRDANLKASDREVQEILEVKLADILQPSAKIQTEVTSPALPNQKKKVNAYRLNEETIIWGATAIMIAELELLLKESNALDQLL